MYKIDEYVTLIVYVEGSMSDKSLAVVKIIMEAHLIDNLKMNMFIENDVLVSQKIKLDLANGEMIIGSC